MQQHVGILFENIQEETIRWEKLLLCGKQQVIAEGEVVNVYTIGALTLLYGDRGSTVVKVLC
jgi:hypothetical protein